MVRTELRFIGTVLLAAFSAAVFASDNRILNVSYDVAREFYAEYNLLFIKAYREKTGRAVRISQSHAGSSKQARAVIDGLPADVITMNQPTDMDAIAEKGRGIVGKDWRRKFLHNASPYTSATAFMVRRGNPKEIKDWDDLIKPGVSIVLPNPKTSGNGRYSYLAAWAFASQRFSGDEDKIREFLSGLFRNVPVLDTGSRGATTAFVHRGVGDVLLSFEAEILTTIQESGPGKFEIVYPLLSVEAEMPIAVNERVVDRRGTRRLATDYLSFLYSEPAQELMVKHFYRPRVAAVAERNTNKFGKVSLIQVDEFFGGWNTAQKTHFSEGGTFDRIYGAGR